MKKVIILFLCFSAMVMADLTEKKKVLVTFPKFGQYSNQSRVYIKEAKKCDFSDSDLKGKGFWGKMIEKFFPKGLTKVVTDLDEKMVYNVNYNDSTFTKTKIEKILEEEGELGEVDEVEAEEEEYEEEESPYRVIRNELKVIDTGEKRKFEQFEGKYYKIVYILEKEHMETKVVKTDSLYVDVYTTSEQDLFAEAGKEKARFQKEYLALLGVEYDGGENEDLLGMNWLNMLSSMDEESDHSHGESGMEPDYGELKKIEGYPFYTDGHFFQKEEDPNKKEKKKKKKSGGFGGFGGIMNKVQKSVEDKVANSGEKKGYQELFSYRYETKEVKIDNVPGEEFEIPKGFEDRSFEE